MSAVSTLCVCSALADYDLLRQEVGSKAASDEVTSALQAMDAKMMQLQLDALNRYTLRLKDTPFVDTFCVYIHLENAHRNTQRVSTSFVWDTGEPETRVRIETRVRTSWRC